MTELLVLVGGLLLSVTLGIFVVSRSPRKRINQLYGMLTSCFVALLFFNYLSLHASTGAIIYIRLVVFSTIWASFAQLFIAAYANNDHDYLFNRPVRYWLLLATIVASSISLTPWTFSSVDIHGLPKADIGVAVFVIHFLVFVSWSVAVLVHSIKNSFNNDRKKYTLMLVALMPILIFAPLTAVVAPIIFNTKDMVYLTPIYIVFYLFMIAYAIIRHGLFDIRFAAVRMAAYLLSLSTMALIYTLLAYILSRVVFQTQSSLDSQIINPINIVNALVLAFIFQPIKIFFDKVTNKVFYREDYDAQMFLDTFSDSIVQQKTLESLSRTCLRVIEEYIKPSVGILIIDNDNTFKKYSIGAATEKLLNDIYPLIKRNFSGKEAFVAGIRDGKLHEVFDEYNVEVIEPLVIRREILGYLILGSKKDGTTYRKKDVNVIKLSAREMAIALQNVVRLEEIRTFNTTLENKIKEATSELRSTNKKLRAIDETKDEFISMASHQLRTPLTSIKGYISMMREGDLGKITPAQGKALDEAYNASQRMVFLIGDFLNLSRLQTGRFELELGEVSLPDIIDEELAQLKVMAAGRNVDLRYDPPVDFPLVSVDGGKIRQVMMNFIDNAIYYANPTNGVVQVVLLRNSRELRFEVRDNGIGVPAAERPHLFTKFYRAANARKVRPDGTGIGLYMAKKVIIAHGGSVIFESKEGEGSTFGFQLPLPPREKRPQ